MSNLWKCNDCGLLLGHPDSLTLADNIKKHRCTDSSQSGHSDNEDGK